MDVLEKFSTHSRRALRDAFFMCRARGDDAVEVAHILCGIAMQRGSIGAELLAKDDIDVDAIEQALGVAAKPAAAPKPIQLSTATRQSIERAALLSSRFGHRYVGTEHLLAGLLEQPGAWLDEFLKRHKISRRLLRERLTVVLKSTTKFPELAEALDAINPADEEPAAPGPRLARTPVSALASYTTELTDAAVQQRIDPLIGREAEVERLIQILSRRTKNNPLLLGDPGVGKTAIVEGLAKKINLGQVPEVLRHRRIFQLDLGLLVAGASYRGEFEQRFKQLLAETKQRPEAILFIDELHTIVGAGSANGAMDAANLMKPSLARGEVRCIGATTLEDYKRHLEHDVALERRFQPVLVRQPDVAETAKILRGLKPSYERFHGVEITEEAIIGAATLADRYLTNKCLPDKAIDVLDEAAAVKKISRGERGGERRLRQLERELNAVLEEKRRAVTDERFEDALSIRAAEQQLRERRAALAQRERHRAPGALDRVTISEVHAVISKMTGVELRVLRADDRQRLARLERTLAERVLGQDHAVKQVADLMRRAKSGIASARRPLGSLLFLGPSGVGKTELAKVLTDAMFGGPDALIRIDMSEFAEGFNISRLIGSPAGYVGYRDHAQLTDEVRKHPHSVVLLDEIEKAHPQVLTLLLQILEDGLLTDATGKTASFRHAVIVMTSNFGTEQFLDRGLLGFSDGAPRDDQRLAEIERELTEKLSDQFPIELLNRIDQTVIFKPLPLPTIAKIADLQLRELAARLAEQRVTLAWSPAVCREIANLSFSPEFGARAVRRTIQQHIETPIAERLLKHRGLRRIGISAAKGNLLIR